MQSDPKWQKHQVLGKGTFGTVTLAKSLDSNVSVPMVAVKSSLVENSSSLKKEGQILEELLGCPHIIRCFGDDYSNENGEYVYNLLLEYAAGGTLENLIKSYGGRLPESQISWFAYILLKGLSHTHEEGYVHCDIKPSNILIFPMLDGRKHLKLADFGLAMKVNGGLTRFRGTPLYASPESVVLGQHEPPIDIWSLGCTVVEMVTGKPAWRCKDINEWFYRIAHNQEQPQIPEILSKNGKDFLVRCLARDPRERWTAEMLLKHPFIIENLTSFGDCSSGETMICREFPFGHFTWASKLDLFSTSEDPQCSSSSSNQTISQNKVAMLGV